MSTQHSSNFRDPMIRDAVALQEKLFEQIRLSSSDPNIADRAFAVLNLMAVCWDDVKAENIRLNKAMKDVHV